MIFDFVKHSECPKELLNNICLLKSQYWHYSIQKQIEWMNRNISQNDVHLILKNEETIIAYLAITKGKIQIDDSRENEFLGIGNVCVDKNYLKREYGFLIMKIAEFYIKQNREIGLLLCQENNVLFYKKGNWLLHNGSTYVCEEKFDHFLFYYNVATLGKKVVLSKAF